MTKFDPNEQSKLALKQLLDSTAEKEPVLKYWLWK